ncbi:unnamed protein product [Rhizoctonia solani]|uniref:Uncharacterized protein n=1 Tax=Rhizoctonia solani TaxID=456999 RepID=A0A8H3GP46_9AGAM|nr:unnamed protein product [Rhizoctonia solani]
MLFPKLLGPHHPDLATLYGSEYGGLGADQGIKAVWVREDTLHTVAREDITVGTWHVMLTRPDMANDSPTQFLGSLPL